MGADLVLGHVVGVVSGQGRQPEVAGDPQQVLADRGLDGDAMIHQLEEVVLLAEDVLVPGGRFQGLVVLAEPQPGLDRAGRAPGGRDDPLVVAVEQVIVHPRPLAVVAFQGRQGADLE